MPIIKDSGFSFIKSMRVCNIYERPDYWKSSGYREGGEGKYPSDGGFTKLMMEKGILNEDGKLVGEDGVVNQVGEEGGGKDTLSEFLEFDERFLEGLERGRRFTEKELKLKNIYKNWDDIGQCDKSHVEKILILTDNEGGLFIILLDFFTPIFKLLATRWENFLAEC